MRVQQTGANLPAVGLAMANAAAKFGLEGWKLSLQQEVKPFGINATIVNPGFFRYRITY